MTEFEKKLIEAIRDLTVEMINIGHKLDVVLKIERREEKRDTAVHSLNLTAGAPVPIKPPAQRIVAQGIDAGQAGLASVPEETEYMNVVRTFTREPKIHAYVTRDMDPKDVPDQVQHLRLLAEYYVMRYCRVKHFSECVSGEPAERLKRLLVTFGELI